MYVYTQMSENNSIVGLPRDLMNSLVRRVWHMPCMPVCASHALRYSSGVELNGQRLGIRHPISVNDAYRAAALYLSSCHVTEPEDSARYLVCHAAALGYR